jgi:hypothetical protein
MTSNHEDRIACARARVATAERLLAETRPEDYRTPERYRWALSLRRNVLRRRMREVLAIQAGKGRWAWTRFPLAR